jgi:hypothetical protein
MTSIPPNRGASMKLPTWRYRRAGDGTIESCLFDLALGEPEGGWYDSPAKVPFEEVELPVAPELVDGGHASAPALDPLPAAREPTTSDLGAPTKQPPAKRGRRRDG